MQRFSEDESRRSSEIVEDIGLDLDENHPEPLFGGGSGTDRHPRTLLPHVIGR